MLKMVHKSYVTVTAYHVVLGKKNSNYALKRFNVAAQPYYVLQGKDGEILGNPRGYDLSVDGFVKFLRDGVQEYKKSK